jgi:hypothetical protein
MSKQAPPLHWGVLLGRVGQPWPQPPQLPASCARLLSQPSVALPLQSPYPALQDAIAHAPPTQPATPLATSPHTIPQPPQSFVLLATEVSQPLATLPSQSAYPAAHWMLHAPCVQAGVPCAVEQTVWQAPQLPTSDARLVSQPFQALPSQSE